MFVAYLVPKRDFHLVVEDGLAFVAVGPSKTEAEAAVRNLFERFADEGDPIEAYVLHSQPAQPEWE